MTNTWTDNLALTMGGSAAEAHPCGFKWVTEAKAHNKARPIGPANQGNLLQVPLTPYG